MGAEILQIIFCESGSANILLHGQSEHWTSRVSGQAEGGVQQTFYGEELQWRTNASSKNAVTNQQLLFSAK